MMFWPLPRKVTLDSGAEGSDFLAGFRNQLQKPYSAFAGPGVRAIWIHFGETISRSFQRPLRRNR